MFCECAVASSAVHLGGPWISLIWGSVWVLFSPVLSIRSVHSLFLPFPSLREAENCLIFYASANNSRRNALCFSSIRPAVRCPSVCQHLFRVMRYLFTQWTDLNETRRKYPSHEWVLQKRFSESSGVTRDGAGGGALRVTPSRGDVTPE